METAADWLAWLCGTRSTH